MVTCDVLSWCMSRVVMVTCHVLSWLHVTCYHVTCFSTKYTVMAGTPEKMVEYILDSCVDGRDDDENGKQKLVIGLKLGFKVRVLCPGGS